MDDYQAKSLIDMAHGGFKERIDYEMPGIISNILDPNTPAKAKRKLTITVEFLADDARKNISANFSVKTSLAPTKPVTTFLYVADDQTIVEMAPQVPGQQSLDDGEQEAPPILKLIKYN